MVFTFIRSLLFSFVMIVATIGVGLSSVIFFIFPYFIRYKAINIYANFVLSALRLICGIKYKIEGIENIPKDKAVIIFCKHQSTWETYILQLIFTCVSFVCKRELLWIPFFGWGLAAMKPISIDRGSGTKAIRQIVSKGTQRLKEGICVVIFPEGTRTTATGPGKYRLGGAMLAEKSGYPVIPVAHHAGEFWPRKGFLKKAGTITVRVGPLISPQGKRADQILDEARIWIESQMPEITQGEYITSDI